MASPTDVMNGDEDLPAARLRELARGVQLLLPDRRDPHLFHEQKSEIVADLRNLARGFESLPQARTGGHRSIQFHMKHPEQLRLSVITAPPGIGRLPPLNTNCLFCRRRRASQGRRQRLRLPGMDLFTWAEEHHR